MGGCLSSLFVHGLLTFHKNTCGISGLRFALTIVSNCS